ncbi:MAG: thioesterase family protein, partial [Actinobacteria bacterium]|nr:thioesterase family protein [Actinomycetota bacterium]
APRFTTHVRVRYAETDAAGVLYYGNYLTYFEVVRLEYLRALGNHIASIEAQGVRMPVVEARLKYLRPARLDDLLEVSVSVESVGPASFAFDYEVTRDGLLLVAGWTRLAVCERDTGRAMPMPGWLRDLFRRTPTAVEDSS